MSELRVPALPAVYKENLAQRKAKARETKEH